MSLAPRELCNLCLAGGNQNEGKDLAARFFPLFWLPPAKHRLQEPDKYVSGKQLARTHHTINDEINDYYYYVHTKFPGHAGTNLENYSLTLYVELYVARRD